MQNRVTNVFNESAHGSARSTRAWDVDRQPQFRLFWLFVSIFLPITVIAARLVHLQGRLTSTFVSGFEWTTESVEQIPTCDGRILAADGRVLAQDVRRLDVHVHYRWLEEPANQTWLRQQAHSRLKKTERRDRSLVEIEQQHVLRMRKRLWQDLANLTQTTADSLSPKRHRIQERVERIVGSVTRRRDERRRELHDRTRGNALNPDETWWRRAWQTVVVTLTTSLTSPDVAPVEVREEREYHPLIENVSLDVAAEIESHPNRFPGVRIHLSTDRVYPYGALAAHVIGARKPVDDVAAKPTRRELAQGERVDTDPGDRIGITGVESSYDRHLRGRRGLKRVVKSRRGEIVWTETIREPRPGGDVVLTLDLPLQSQMENLLDSMPARATKTTPEEDAAASEESKTPQNASAGSSIVALDVRTGEVLLAVSSPRYDLNLLLRPDFERWQRLLDDPRRPFFPRATQMALPPGSVFKALTSVAVLESRVFGPNELIHCQGFLHHPDRFRCYHSIGHGDMDLSDAVCRSCNVYFFSAAERMGPGPIVEWARRFGFGQPTGLDLPRERGGNLPSPEAGSPSGAAKKRSEHARQPTWHNGNTLQLAIGQASLTVTPMQVARLMAAIANDGYLVTPHVVRDTGPTFVRDDRQERTSHREPYPIPGLSPGTLARIRRAMQKVVADPRGTGYKTVRLDEVRIAGKTGTAEVGPGKEDHAWFAGFVPADNPRIAFAVVLEHAGTGGRFAGPVARKLVAAMLERGLLPRTEITLLD
jgi:penicillin-binding protein 2